MKTKSGAFRTPLHAATILAMAGGLLFAPAAKAAITVHAFSAPIVLPAGSLALPAGVSLGDVASVSVSIDDGLPVGDSVTNVSVTVGAHSWNFAPFGASVTGVHPFKAVNAGDSAIAVGASGLDDPLAPTGLLSVVLGDISLNGVDTNVLPLATTFADPANQWITFGTSDFLGNGLTGFIATNALAVPEPPLAALGGVILAGWWLRTRRGDHA